MPTSPMGERAPAKASSRSDGQIRRRLRCSVRTTADLGRSIVPRPEVEMTWLLCSRSGASDCLQRHFWLKPEPAASRHFRIRGWPAPGSAGKPTGDGGDRGKDLLWSRFRTRLRMEAQITKSNVVKHSGTHDSIAAGFMKDGSRRCASLRGSDPRLVVRRRPVSLHSADEPAISAGVPVCGRMHGTVADSARGLDSLPRAALCSGGGFAMDSLPFLPAGVRLHAAGLYWLFFAAPGFLGLLALRTGNIAVICWGAMLLAGSLGLIRNRWFVFYVVVFLCCPSRSLFFR